MEEFEVNPLSVRVVFIRHGHDTGSLSGDPKRDLTENGIRQAKASAEFLKNIDFDHIYTSDLLRTVQTSGYICTLQEQSAVPNSGLREIRPFYLMGNPELTEEAGAPIHSFLNKIREHSKGSRILAVAHCHLIRYVLTLKSLGNNEVRTVVDLFQQGLVKRNGCTIDMSNCAVSVVDIFSDGRLEPRLINYHEHTKVSNREI